MTVPFRFAPAKTAWFAAMLVPALLFTPSAFTWTAALAAAALIGVTVVFGHTVGLHRGIIHRTYRTGPVTRGALATLFALTGLGSPLAWIRVHYLRDHHQSRPTAPITLRYDHDLLTDAWWTLCCAPVDVDWAALRIPSSDTEDPVIVALDRLWIPLQLVQAVVLYAVGGWSLLVLGWFARNALVIVGHWYVGYVAHTTGWRRYAIDGATEEGRNLWLLGILSFGEGFHNNHHAAPSSARMGRAWYEPDVGYLALCALERAGLVWDVHHPRDLDDLLKPGARRLSGPAPALTAPAGG